MLFDKQIKRDDLLTRRTLYQAQHQGYVFCFRGPCGPSSTQWAEESLLGHSEGAWKQQWFLLVGLPDY